MERAELVYEVRELLKGMSSGEERMEFIQEVMDGHCTECGDALYGGRCYCKCND